MNGLGDVTGADASPLERREARWRLAARSGGLLGVAVSVLAVSAGCSSMMDGPPPPEDPRPVAMTASPASASLASLGDTANFTATIRDQNGAVFSGSVTWSSSDPGVFAVNSAGLVTALGNGTGTVTASHRNLSATASVVVAQEPAAIVARAGDGQVGLGGRELPEAVEVEVRDAGGAPVAGVTVTFAVVDGHGSVEPAAAESDSSGAARTAWTLGDDPGAQQLTASVQGSVSVQVAATAVPELPVVPVCDRTAAVRDALVGLAGRAGCADVSARDLAGIDTLELGGAGISVLKTGDFSGLDSLKFLGLAGNQVAELPGAVFSGLAGLGGLDLRANQLDELPRGIFEGLAGLELLRLSDNPGAPFGLRLELLRADTTRLGAPGPASITLVVAQGAPFAISLPVAVQYGSASAAAVTVGPGETSGPAITVQGPTGDSTVTQLTPGAAPSLPGGFDGIELRTGAALALFDPSANTATYRVVFVATWSATTHPADFPSGAHFSPLIGAVHDDGATLWALGELATPGIESMAETGATGALTSEVDDKIPDHALSVINGRGINSPGSTTISAVTVREDFPLVTLVTMIAPSPDWFVGVNGLSLLGEDGRWAEELVVVLHPLDSGTDSGTTYRSANRDTSPKQAIRSLKGVAPFSNAQIGTFTLTRVSGSATSRSR